MQTIKLSWKNIPIIIEESFSILPVKILFSHKWKVFVLSKIFFLPTKTNELFVQFSFSNQKVSKDIFWWSRNFCRQTHKKCLPTNQIFCFFSENFTFTFQKSRSPDRCRGDSEPRRRGRCRGQVSDRDPHFHERRGTIFEIYVTVKKYLVARIAVAVTANRDVTVAVKSLTMYHNVLIHYDNLIEIFFSTNFISFLKFFDWKVLTVTFMSSLFWHT